MNDITFWWNNCVYSVRYISKKIIKMLSCVTSDCVDGGMNMWRCLLHCLHYATSPCYKTYRVTGDFWTKGLGVDNEHLFTYCHSSPIIFSLQTFASHTAVTW